jgi:hypothetical protein
MLFRFLVLTTLLSAVVTPATSDGFDSPTILVLGDSQIPFGAGPAFLEFFENIKAHCPAPAAEQRTLDPIADGKVAVIGVRSTSLPSWTAARGAAKGALCDVDPKWGVNAGVFGFINRSDTIYKQIGRGAEYQFCEPGKSAFETMFRPDYYDPRLIVLSFLGNSTARWAESYGKALEDVRRMNAQLPDGVACVFIPTAPAFSEKTTARRLVAQENLKRAFVESGSQCSFVEGTSPETMRANHGNTAFFRTSKSGRVKDPYHPNEKAAKAFFKIGMKRICAAVFDQLPAIKPDMADMRNRHAVSPRDAGDTGASAELLRSSGPAR